MKQSIILLVALLPTLAIGQVNTSPRLQSLLKAKESFEALSRQYADSSAALQPLIDAEIKRLDEERVTELKYQIKKAGMQGIPTVVEVGCDLLSDGLASASVVGDLSRLDAIQILNADKFPYYLVKRKKKTGYVFYAYISIQGLSIEGAHRALVELVGVSDSGAPSQAQFQAPSSQYAPSTYNSGSSSGSSSSTIHTGPRGGKYYYTSSGKKRYVSQGKTKN